MDRVRVGLAGLGTIANVMHLPGLKTMEEMGKVELVCGCDVDEQAARTTADRFGIGAVYASLDEMLAAESFDLLVNLTRIPDHFGVTLTALRAGRSVYTQKPMATSVDEATYLVDEARRRGLDLASAPEHPVRPVIEKARSMIEAGELGKIAFAKVRASHFGPETHEVPRDSTWFYKPGSSPILDLGVHGLSMITGILGPAKRISCVSGRTRDVRYHTAGLYKGKQIEVEIDDNSLLTLDFGGATFAWVDSTYCVAASKAPDIEIYGSLGTLAIERRGINHSLQWYKPDEAQWVDIEVPAVPPVRDLGVFHMVNHLLDGTPLVLTSERGRHLVDIMAGAVEAAERGCAVDLTTSF
jgi:predicted dehydrogenase